MPVEVVYDHTDSIFTIRVDNPKNSSGNLITPIYRYLGQDIKVNNIESKSTLSRFGTTEVVVEYCEQIEPPVRMIEPASAINRATQCNRESH